MMTNTKALRDYIKNADATRPIGSIRTKMLAMLDLVESDLKNGQAAVELLRRMTYHINGIGLDGEQVTNDQIVECNKRSQELLHHIESMPAVPAEQQ